jgi:O-antigen ligase
MYTGEVFLITFALLNANKIVKLTRKIKYISQVWQLNLIVILAITIYGYISEDFLKHAETSLQYGFCILIILPSFCYLSAKHYKSTVFGIYLGVPIAVFLVSQVLLFDKFYLAEVFNYDLTGGIFQRAGLIGVNDYGIILVVCALLILYSRSPPIIVNIFLMLVFCLIIMTGSRVAIIIFIMNLVLSQHFKKIIYSWKIIYFVPLFAFIGKLAYENFAGLKRLSTLNFRDGERGKLFFDAIQDVELKPWGTGFQQYLNSDLLFPVHNFYLLVLVELGLVFGILFIFCVLLTLFTCIDNIKDRNIIPLISFLLIISTITHAYDKFLWYIPGLILSLTISKRLSKFRVA